MTPSDLEDLKTVCCGANYIRLGHQRYVCDDCKQDKSFEFIQMADAMDRADAAERIKRLGQWRESSKNDPKNKELKRKLGLG